MFLHYMQDVIELKINDNQFAKGPDNQSLHIVDEIIKNLLRFISRLNLEETNRIIVCGRIDELVNAIGTYVLAERILDVIGYPHINVGFQVWKVYFTDFSERYLRTPVSYTANKLKEYYWGPMALGLPKDKPSYYIRPASSDILRYAFNKIKMYLEPTVPEYILSRE